jgi:hypothetical protein
MPNRIVRDGILTSEPVNSLSEAAENFYRRLINVVDDYGRYSANPTLLRAACYPLKLDQVREEAIEDRLAECERVGLIETYVVDGKRFLHLRNFRQQVRAKASKYPNPPTECSADAQQMHSTCLASAKHMHSTCSADAQHMIADAHLDEFGDEYEFGDGDGGGKRRKRRTPAPKAFEITADLRSWAEAKGLRFDLDAETERFLDYHRSKGNAHSDWKAAWRNWMAKAVQFGTTQLRQVPTLRAGEFD